jgi:hypothetical protein
VPGRCTLERGYGVNREESEAGVSAVAAPVLDRTGRAMAAISITGSSRRLDLDRLAPAVRTAALALSRELTRTTLGVRSDMIHFSDRFPDQTWAASADSGCRPYGCTDALKPPFSRGFAG